MLYDNVLKVWDLIHEAWTKKKGTIKIFLFPIFIMLFVHLSLYITIKLLKGSAYINLSHPIFWIGQILLGLLMAGLIYMGIVRAFDLPLSVKHMFRAFEPRIIMHWIIFQFLYFIFIFPLFFLFLLPFIVFADTTKDSPPIGFVMILLFSMIGLIGFLSVIYVQIRFSLGLGFILDKKVKSAWEAIKFSVRATKNHVLSLFYLYAITTFILLISMIPFGLGLIWTIPFACILYGIIYKTLSEKLDR